MSFSHFLQQTHGRLDAFATRWAAVEALYALMGEYSVQVPEQDEASRKMLDHSLSQLRYLVAVVDAAQEEKTAQFTDEIDKGISALRTRADELLAAADAEAAWGDEEEEE